MDPREGDSNRPDPPGEEFFFSGQQLLARVTGVQSSGAVHLVGLTYCSLYLLSLLYLSSVAELGAERYRTVWSGFGVDPRKGLEVWHEDVRGKRSR